MLPAPPPQILLPSRLGCNPTPPPSLLFSCLSDVCSDFTLSSFSSGGPVLVLSPFHIPDVFLLYSLSSCLRRKRPEGMMFFVFPVLHSILYPKNLEMFSAHCKHSINTCGMNERMNEFQSASADEAIFNARQSSAAIWCQKLELQV